jgi:hypothetical protein
LGFFLINLAIVLCLNKIMQRARVRQQHEIRRTMVARLLFLANLHNEFEAEERARRRSLLTESFITE